MLEQQFFYRYFAQSAIVILINKDHFKNTLCFYEGDELLCDVEISMGLKIPAEGNLEDEIKFLERTICIKIK